MFGERFQRFARGEAGRDEVLDHQDPRARGDRKSLLSRKRPSSRSTKIAFALRHIDN
jgi:hypothetical protein